jgi:acyl carrier protein
MADEIRTIVISELERFCPPTADRPREFLEHLRLADDLGLASIDVVELFDSIAGRIGPLREVTHYSTDLRTVGDLCRAFETSIPGPLGKRASDDRSELMTAAASRAKKRLARRGRSGTPGSDSTE